MATSNCLVTNILQNIIFCVQWKKEIHTGLEQREGENMMIKCYFFRVICPYK